MTTYQPAARPARRGARRRHRCRRSPRTTASFNGEQRTLVGRRRLRRPVAPRRGPDQRSRPAHLAALADHPAPRGARARRCRPRRWCSRPTATSSTRCTASTTARPSRPHVEPGAAAALVGVAGPDAVHDAGRGRATSPTSSPWPGARSARRSSTRGHDARRTTCVPRAELDDVRRGGRPGLRHLGLRGAADRPRRAALRPRHRPPHHPQRGRLDPVRPCTSTRAATAARRPSPGCTPSAGRRAG